MEVSQRIVVTGATGFIGSALVRRLSAQGVEVVGVTRQRAPAGDQAVRSWLTVEAIGPHTQWAGRLENVDVVVHLAAIAHLAPEHSSEALAHYREVNVYGTERLARCAAASGVKRFIFLSTVKIHGEETGRGPAGQWQSFKENDQANPQDAYAISKWEAEQTLEKTRAETGMDTVILRPPLVYGPGVGANFLRLLKLVYRGMPTPLRAVRNRRSLIYVENLVDALIACISFPIPINNTFLVSDAVASTPDLIRSIGKALRRPVFLFSLPAVLLRAIALVSGKKAIMDRLLGSLVVDCSLIQKQLGWSAHWSVDQGLQTTARWFLQTREGNAQVCFRNFPR
ncbi:MAG: NAD-dependent epimerase/dehydratase family protein [Gammaproteobacteria bacterium]